jgi:hypothetical protein
MESPAVGGSLMTESPGMSSVASFLPPSPGPGRSQVPPSSASMRPVRIPARRPRAAQSVVSGGVASMSYSDGDALEYQIDDPLAPEVVAGIAAKAKTPSAVMSQLTKALTGSVLRMGGSIFFFFFFSLFLNRVLTSFPPTPNQIYEPPVNIGHCRAAQARKGDRGEPEPRCCMRRAGPADAGRPTA